MPARKLWRPNARKLLNTNESDTGATAVEGTFGARGILEAWQHLSFRGWVVAEMRLDRARIVQALISQLRSEHVTVDVLILAADDVTCGQWERLLSSDPTAPARWEARTAEAVLEEGGRVRSDRVVVADELEVYVSADLVAAIKGARAILGLCGTQRGLSDVPQLRKHIGRELKSVHAAFALDMQSLTVPPEQVDGHEDLEDDGIREQLLEINDPQDLFYRYLTEIAKFALLTAEEEIELAKRIEAGLYCAQIMIEFADAGKKLTTAQRRDFVWICREGVRAKTRFLSANLRLVVSLAKRYSPRLELMDAIQEGNLGLIRAVEKFDYTKGFKFSTYATWWIRQAITRAIADQTNLIRIPVHQFENDNPILTEWRRQSREAAGPPASDIAEALEIDISTVETVLRRHQPPLSLELMIEDGFDLVDPEAHTIAQEKLVFAVLKDQLESVLETLSEREAGVVRLRFGLTDDQPRTLDEIGQVYGVTRERIRQIETKVMAKLRHPSRSDSLRDYFDGIIDPGLIIEDEAR